MRKDQAYATIERALACSRAEHCEVTLTGYAQASTRFSNNAITQNIAKSDQSLTALAAFGQKKGKASTNDLSDEGIASCVRRAEEIARQSEPDTEFLPPVEPSPYKEIQAYFPRTQSYGPEDRARSVHEVCAVCEGSGLRGAGSFANEGWFLAAGNSRKHLAYTTGTEARFLCTVLGSDSSGWAEAIANDVAQVDPVGTAWIAKQKAEASRNPVAIEPRKYTVILEPSAVAEMILFMLFSMDAKSAHEGRSGFAGKEGQQVASSLITLRNRPDHRACPGLPFMGGDWDWIVPSNAGVPVPETTWIDRGVLKNLMYSRFWAQRTGHPYTGIPTNLIMDGGDLSVDQMIASLEEGLLVTRFWYIRYVDPMTLLFTGMTRDGLFKIEGGRIKHGVKNLRFNESPLKMLLNTTMVGRPTRTGMGLPNLIPPLLVKDFTFTSGTSF
jgi:predicted Zn-dependent protease